MALTKQYTERVKKNSVKKNSFYQMSLLLGSPDIYMLPSGQGGFNLIFFSFQKDINLIIISNHAMSTNYLE